MSGAAWLDGALTWRYERAGARLSAAGVVSMPREPVPSTGRPSSSLKGISVCDSEMEICFFFGVFLVLIADLSGVAVRDELGVLEAPGAS